jgi:lipid-A-disaccharide synthase
VPEVVCYRTSAISYALAKRLIRIPFISLVNLILEKEAVRELIQDELNEENLVSELRKILPGGSKHEQQMRDYERLGELVGGAGASERTGALIASYLQ